MTQDSVSVTYTVEGFSHDDLTNALGNGLPKMSKDTIVETYAISDTDLVYYNGGHEFVEIIKTESISKPELPNSNSYNTGILVGLAVLGVFLLKKLLK